MRFAVLCLVPSLLLTGGCGRSKASKLRIATTTSLIGTAAKMIGGDRVDIVTIVPAGMCPGHFDVKPKEVELIADARLFLAHGWEPWMDDMIGAVANRQQKVEVVDLPGNWMVPDVHLKAVERIRAILCQVDPEGCEYFAKRSEDYQEKIRAAAEEIREEAARRGVGDVNIICSDMQAEFLSWLGFNIIARYGRPSELNPKEMAEIICRARNSNVRLVVDNLQSGSDAGVRIAEEIGADHIIISNFPMHNSYIETLRENGEKLLLRLRPDDAANH